MPPPGRPDGQRGAGLDAEPLLRTRTKLHEDEHLVPARRGTVDRTIQVFDNVARAAAAARASVRLRQLPHDLNLLVDVRHHLARLLGTKRDPLEAVRGQPVRADRRVRVGEVDVCVAACERA